MISKEGQTRVYGFVQLIVLEYSVDIFDFRYFRIFDIFDIRDLDSDSVCIGVVRAFASTSVFMLYTPSQRHAERR